MWGWQHENGSIRMATRGQQQQNGTGRPAAAELHCGDGSVRTREHRYSIIRKHHKDGIVRTEASGWQYQEGSINSAVWGWQYPEGSIKMATPAHQHQDNKVGMAGWE